MRIAEKSTSMNKNRKVEVCYQTEQLKTKPKSAIKARHDQQGTLLTVITSETCTCLKKHPKATGTILSNASGYLPSASSLVTANRSQTLKKTKKNTKNNALPVMHCARKPVTFTAGSDTLTTAVPPRAVLYV